MACLPLSPVNMVPATSIIPAVLLHLLISQAPAFLLYHPTEAFAPNTHSTISVWRAHLPPNPPGSHHDTFVLRHSKTREAYRLPLTLKGYCPFHSQESEPEPTPHGAVCTHCRSPVFISYSEQDTMSASILQKGN